MKKVHVAKVVDIFASIPEQLSLYFSDFSTILQIRCLMRPGRQDLNVIFFYV